MFSIKEQSETEYQLLINKELYADVEIGKDPFHNFDIETTDHKTSQALSNHKISDFTLLNIETIRLGNWCEWSPMKNHIFVTDLIHHLDNYDISFTFFPNFQRWKQSYSYSEYFDFLVKEIETDKTFSPNITPLEFGEIDWFEIEFNIGGSDKNLHNEIVLRESYLHNCHKKALKVILELERNISVTSSFDFPAEIKVTCEQYILYFAKFLQDLGINATSNLKEEAGKVLFSVTPTDDVEALDKIREAPAVYLNLPASPIVYDDSFAAMRLQQQVENLQHAQKMAAREIQLTEKLLVVQSATIQEKNLIISQKDSVIEQKDKIIEKILSRSIMMDSAENKEKLEEIYDGLKIGESKFLKEQLGIHINPAKFIKTAVKNTFGKDDEKNSVLGLAED